MPWPTAWPRAAIAAGVLFASAAWSGPAAADCSFGRGLACAIPISWCLPALAANDNRASFITCLKKVANDFCLPCVAGLDPQDASLTDPNNFNKGVGASAHFLTIARTLASRAVAPNGDGRLELAYVGSDGVVRHFWQDGGAGWLGPAAFPGSSRALGFATVVQAGDGPLEVYAVTPDGGVARVRQLAPNVNWGGWQSLGGTMKDVVVAALRADSSRALVGIGRDRQLYYAVDPNLNDWRPLGGAWQGIPALGVNADGRLEVFAVTPTGILQHRWELSPGQWSSWADLGAGVRGDPVAIRALDGTLVVAVTTTSGGLRIFQQAAPNVGWKPATTLVGTHSGRPTIVMNGDGALEVFVTGVTDRAVYHARQTIPGGAFGPWRSLGGTVLASPAAALNSDGTMTVFAIGQDHGIWGTRRSDAGDGPWRAWARIGGASMTERF